MNKTLLLPLLAVPFQCVFAQENEKKDNRPNIIVFLVDDMGWQDTSLPFWTEQTAYNEIYETPNMERLAKQGMLFTQAYASSVSSPSRCSLLTGMNAARHRVTNWTYPKNGSTDLESETLLFPAWNVNGLAQVGGIPRTTQVTSLPQLLKDNGFHTIHCGKAHWGAVDTPGENPHHFGFEVNIAGHAGGGLASYLGEANFGNRTDGKANPRFAIPGLEAYWGEDIFVTEVLTREACKALDKAQQYEQPFFLYLSHYAIHIPIDKDMRFFPKYIEKGLTEKEAAYASLIEGMDKSLGDLMDYLEENKLADNTILLFMSDNGGLSSTAAWRDGALHTQNAPLNSGKGSAYEGGIREPMIVSWPAKVKAGSKCDKYLLIEDFFPTILEMAGVSDYQTVQTTDGISFVPLLTQTGNPSAGRSLIWNFPNLWGNTGPGIGPSCTIRQDDWKLIYYYETGKKELFHIPTDIGEKENLIEKEPERAIQLSRLLGEELRIREAQRPSFKVTGKAVPWPDEI
ncbi:arylsulfatase A-like enzyme [Parabacteroides sp. PM5-20]|uniref:sulfatase n=1 Tax=Parabacteroides sp. PM5-20 TaxID=2940527 RepID=UPI0024767B79|nr:sulfatase [Parabacteroides sp. PM5-20]MDH6534113.1 arylsulfatase A-like enzyme [Parabacteroides sp. PM5-20]